MIRCFLPGMTVEFLVYHWVVSYILIQVQCNSADVTKCERRASMYNKMFPTWDLNLCLVDENHVS